MSVTNLYARSLDWICVSPTSKVLHARAKGDKDRPLAEQYTLCGIVAPIPMMLDDKVNYRRCKRCLKILEERTE